MQVFKIIIISFILFSINATAESVEIEGLKVKFVSSKVIVSFSFKLDKNSIQTLKDGGKKEIIFYIDLFREWELLPDEFITGVKLVRTLYSDPMKKEYIASSFNGETLLVKRFKSFDSMIKWALTFRNIYIANMKAFAEATYFVRVTAEAKSKGIPSIITEIFFFLPSREFKIYKDSFHFIWKNGKLIK